MPVRNGLEEKKITCVAKHPPNDGKQLAAEKPPSKPKTLPMSDF